ncbi:MAG TPA: Hpt domain-containing protein [Thermoanaerobaculia bacterium]|nr:Hpt domain-containing protein [Thermoanaerobaculia bacterium]
MTLPFLEELRPHFRAATRERLRQMRAQLDALAADPAQAEPLLRNFHALTGLGGTYGFPRLSELGDEAEETLLAVVRRGAPLTPELERRWREIVEEMEREVGGA